MQPSPPTSEIPTPALSDVKRRILAAALELFAERGFSSATTMAIAKRAAIAEKTLFAHFKTKEILFEETISPATVELLVADWKDPLRGIESDASTLEDFFFELMKNRMAVYRRNPTKFKLIVQELLLRPERARRFIATVGAQSVPRVEKSLRRLQERGELGDVPFALVHQTSLSLLFGYAISALLFWPDKVVDDEIELRDVVRVLVGGLRTSRPRAGARSRRRAEKAAAARRREPTGRSSR